jgi:hypothetical protein
VFGRCLINDTAERCPCVSADFMYLALSVSENAVHLSFRRVNGSLELRLCRAVELCIYLALELRLCLIDEMAESDVCLIDDAADSDVCLSIDPVDFGSFLSEPAHGFFVHHG